MISSPAVPHVNLPTTFSRDEVAQEGHPDTSDNAISITNECSASLDMCPLLGEMEYMSGASNGDGDLDQAYSTRDHQDCQQPPPESYKCHPPPVLDQDQDTFIAAALPDFLRESAYKPNLELIPYRRCKTPSTPNLTIIASFKSLAAQCFPNPRSEGTKSALNFLLSNILQSDQSSDSAAPLGCPACGRPWSDMINSVTGDCSSTLKQEKEINSPESASNVVKLEEVMLPLISPLENLVDLVAKELGLPLDNTMNRSARGLPPEKQQKDIWMEESVDLGLVNLYSDEETQQQEENMMELEEEASCPTDHSDMFQELLLDADMTKGSEFDLSYESSPGECWEGGEPEFWV